MSADDVHCLKWLRTGRIRIDRGDLVRRDASSEMSAFKGRD